MMMMIMEVMMMNFVTYFYDGDKAMLRTTMTMMMMTNMTMPHLVVHDGVDKNSHAVFCENLQWGGDVKRYIVVNVTTLSLSSSLSSYPHSHNHHCPSHYENYSLSLDSRLNEIPIIIILIVVMIGNQHYLFNLIILVTILI